MATLYEIPTSAQPQTFTVTLAGVPYNLRLIYCGATAAVPPSVASTLTVIDCDFSAPNGVLLEDFTNPTNVGSTFMLLTTDSGEIVDDTFVGLGGPTAYMAAGVPQTADYLVQFKAVPTTAGPIGTSTLFVIGRATPTYNGYKASITSDGTQYYLNLIVMGSPLTTITSPLGVLPPSAFYMVTLSMVGSQIAVSVQRSFDNAWLDAEAVWIAEQDVAILINDITFTLSGRVIMGGSW